MSDSQNPKPKPELSLKFIRHELSNALSLVGTGFVAATRHSAPDEVGRKLHQTGMEKLENLIASLDEQLSDPLAR